MKKQVNFNYFSLVKVCTIDGTKYEYPLDEVFGILKDKYDLPKEERRLDIKRAQKVCFLESLSEKEGYMFGIFATAKHDYRPPIVDTTNLSERDNPCGLNEGGKERTYFAIKRIEGSTPRIVLMLQRTNKGFNVNTFRDYILPELRGLSEANSRYTILSNLIMSDDFFRELKRMGRTNSMEISYDKKILTDHFSDFGGNICELRDTVTMTLKVENKKNMLEIAKTIVNCKFGANRDGIQNVVLHGYDVDNHTMDLDMANLTKVSSGEVEKRKDTGELLEQDVFKLIDDYMGKL